MREHITKLEDTWLDERGIIDYQGLKDIRFECDQVDRKLRFLVNEWNKCKHGEMLTDYLVDTVDKLYDEYFKKYTRMADEKRKESAVRRKKEQEIMEYKNEKKRTIPTWPEKFPYSKYKPDVISWDIEHHLASGLSRFWQLIEMLKKEGRYITFEPISTRLGKHRDEKNIIPKIILLLDAINDKTCFNKLSRAWDQITNLKRNSSETLNEFFSRFKTVQFSLNNADDSYVEPSNKASAEEKELMAGRKLELNDKLKAVVLLKCLDGDESAKRDIMAKLDFQKEPSEVYASTKIAIRDICGA